MNKNGFTLIEIIAVVAIIGLLGTVVTVSLINTYKNTSDEKCNDFIKEIEDAACVYTSTHDICEDDECQVSLQELNDNGLLTQEVDACNNAEINLSDIVKVSWDDNGNKKCSYERS